VLLRPISCLSERSVAERVKPGFRGAGTGGRSDDEVNNYSRHALLAASLSATRYITAAPLCRAYRHGYGYQQLLRVMNYIIFMFTLGQVLPKMSDCSQFVQKTPHVGHGGRLAQDYRVGWVVGSRLDWLSAKAESARLVASSGL
jgi:hypothetical protein